MSNDIVLKNRRFRCLSPSLVRLEFALEADFEDRRSIVAYEEQDPVAFSDESRDGEWDVLDTGAVQIRTRQNHRPFDRTNLEIRWTDGRLMQCWRPGDRDHQNLGGTLRSLDRYGGASAELDGVHEAGMEAPDPRATTWPAWIQCEEAPLYRELHPNPPDNLDKGSWLRLAAADHNDGRIMERFFNRYKEARKFCPGVLSRSGYYFLNDSNSAVMDEDDFPIERDRPGCQDWYFFAYGDDYKQALGDFRTLAGPAPLPPHHSLGIMFSRWPAFSKEEIEELHDGFEQNGYPLSVLIMDMEWHEFGWGHWDFNTDLIPDPDEFFEWCHDHELAVAFNDHPLDVRSDDSHFDEYLEQADTHDKIHDITYGDLNGEPQTLPAVPVDITSKRENTAFREVCHQHILDAGLDFWWNDGSRGKMSHTCGQLVANKSFYEEVEDEGRRGMLLARYGGLGSHRYGGFFTGDTASCYEVLRLQCEFNVRASHVGLNYVSHDIGGFMTGGGKTERIDPQLYCRWLQFGVFNPVLRFHCAPNAGSRRPWDYDDDCGGACRHWLRVRHSLLPYLNTANHTCYETGIPVVRGMFIEEPGREDAYRYDQFYFGPDMLVAPVLSKKNRRSVYLPDGRWWEFESDRWHHGNATITRDVPVEHIPVYVRAGSILPRQNPDDNVHAAHIDPLILDVYGGADGEAELREDDGQSPAYKDGDYRNTHFGLEDGEDKLRLTIHPAEGQNFGDKRDIRVRFHVDFRPASVMWDGEELDWDGGGISLADVPVGESCTVTVRK